MICYFLWGIIFYPGSIMDVHSLTYTINYIALPMVFIGLFALFTLSSKISCYPKMLLLVGRNSLVIYMLDWIPLIVSRLFYKLPPTSNNMCIPFTILYLIWSSLVCILIAKVLNKYIPWSTGNRQ